MRDWKLLWLTNVRYRDHDITAHGERPGADHDYSHEFDYDELHRLIEAKRGDAIGAASALVWGEISDRAYGEGKPRTTSNRIAFNATDFVD